MSNARVDAVARFVRQDPIFYSNYLLTAGRLSDLPIDSFESQLLFVLWFLAEGREVWSQPVVLDAAVLDAVLALDPEGCHPLMVYLAGRDGLALGGHALRAWYYGEAVPRRGLAPFLGAEERRALRAPSAVLPDGGGTDDPAGAARRGLRERLPGLLAAADALPERVAIVGFHRSVMGLGEDARGLFDCLCEAGIAAELVDLSPAGLEPFEGADRYGAFEVRRPTAPVIIFCLPVFEMMRALPALGLGWQPEGQYRIGYWAWETTALPDYWRHGYAMVDEVWASSTFLRDVYGGETGKPVLHVPLHVRVDPPAFSDDLNQLFGRHFTFVTVFDFNSRIERKNPTGAIEAFQRAFPPGIADVQLILKTLHGQNRQADLDAIAAVVAGDDRVVVIDGALPRAELCGLIRLSDAYLSLHRSEGFGRPIAEAMLLQTPVVATGWSGCADFLTERTGYPVASVLRDLRPGEYPFAAGQWAEPDIDHAATLMRQLYDRGQAPASLLRKAERTIETGFGLQPVAARVRERLRAILGQGRTDRSGEDGR